MFNLTKRFLGFLPLLFVGVALCTPALARAEDRVVAVVSIQTPPSLAAQRATIEANVAKGLREARWSVLDLADTTRLVGSDKALLGCTGEVCAVQLVRLTKAHFLVWADVTESKRQYAINVRFFDGTKGALPMASEYETFPSPKDVAPQIATLASAVGFEAAGILDDLAHADVVSDEGHPLVAVASVKLPPSLQHAQDKAESAVGRGLEMAGWDVASVFESTRAVEERKDLKDCVSAACMAEIGRITKAPYLVVASLVMGKKKYTVSVSLFDAANVGRPLVHEEQDCVDGDPGCPPLARKISFATRDAGRKALTMLSKGGGQSPPVAAANARPIPSAGRNEQPGSDRISLAPGEAEPHTGLKIAGWTLLGSGIALLGGSAILFAYDGKKTNCEDTAVGQRCFQRYDNKTQGYITGGIGLVGALVGSYILLFPAREHATSVAVSPRGILVGGAF
jgi:hypothetical protein